MFVAVAPISVELRLSDGGERHASETKRQLQWWRYDRGRPNHFYGNSPGSHDTNTIAAGSSASSNDNTSWNRATNTNSIDNRVDWGGDKSLSVWKTVSPNNHSWKVDDDRGSKSNNNNMEYGWQSLDDKLLERNMSLERNKLLAKHTSQMQDNGRGPENGMPPQNEIFRSGGRFRDTENFDVDNRLVGLDRQATIGGRESEERIGEVPRGDTFPNRTGLGEGRVNLHSVARHRGQNIGESDGKTSKKILGGKFLLTDSQRVESITLREGHKTAIECESSGSRPPALYIWKRDGRVLRNDSYKTTLVEPKDQTQDDSFPNLATYSISSLVLEPRYEDHGSQLSCLAYSPNLPNETLVKDISLNILCKYM